MASILCLFCCEFDDWHSSSNRSFSWILSKSSGDSEATAVGLLNVEMPLKSVPHIANAPSPRSFAAKAAACEKDGPRSKISPTARVIEILKPSSCWVTLKLRRCCNLLIGDNNIVYRRRHQAGRLKFGATWREIRSETGNVTPEAQTITQDTVVWPAQQTSFIHSPRKTQFHFCWFTRWQQQH